MTHMIVWHDNGNRAETFATCGYTEEITDCLNRINSKSFMRIYYTNIQRENCAY